MHAHTKVFFWGCSEQNKFLVIVLILINPIQPFSYLQHEITGYVHKGQGKAKPTSGQSQPMDVANGFDIQVHHRNQVYYRGHTIRDRKKDYKRACQLFDPTAT
jgi:hypothetical protein